MKKSYITNPITDELIREGIIITTQHSEVRTIIDNEGKNYQEIAVTIKYKDPRQFVKTFPDGVTKFLQLYEGNTKAQMPYIVEAALEKSIHKDYIYLTYRDVCTICMERGVEIWTKSQLSKNIKWFLDNDMLFRVTDDIGKYWINTKLYYNGMFHRQIGLSNSNEQTTELPETM
jgi:L-asparaginase II